MVVWVGNILGSNIFNMLLIIGVSAMIRPIVYNTSYNLDMMFVIFGTVVLALFPIIPPKNRMSRQMELFMFWCMRDVWQLCLLSKIGSFANDCTEIFCEKFAQNKLMESFVKINIA